MYKPALIYSSCVLVVLWGSIERGWAQEQRTAHSVEEGTGTPSFDLWAGLERVILDRPARQELRDLDSTGILGLLVQDYEEALETLRGESERPERQGCGVLCWVRQLQELEQSLWRNCSAVLDESGIRARTSDIDRVRERWVRRTWLDRPGAVSSLLPAGIDLSEFIGRDWLTREFCHGDSATDPSTESPDSSLTQLARRYEHEMAFVLDGSRIRFYENGEAANRAVDPEYRRKLNRERFLLVAKPYQITRRYADRMTELLVSRCGRTRAYAWRERVLQASHSLLFGVHSGMSSQEVACLAFLEDAASRDATAPDSVLTLAELRWRAAGEVHRLLQDALRNEGEYPPALSNPAVLERLNETALRLDDAVARAACDCDADILPTSPWRRWSQWFPVPRDVMTR